MIDRPLPLLSTEEREMSISEYYDIPVPSLDAIQQQVLSHSLDSSMVTRPEDIGTLFRPSGYTGSDYGYCMCEDGSGFLATYTHFCKSDMKMLKWWFDWMNTRPANMPAGKGNIKYKVWCPYGHFDHGVVQLPDGTSCVCATEALDLCEEGDPVDHIYMHPIDLHKFGVSQEMTEQLDAMDCAYNMSYETFDYPGMHLCMSLMRPHPNGGVELIGREWIGYGVRDNKIVRDEATFVDEAFLKKIVRHCSTEMMRLDDILPGLYAKYHDKPAAAEL